MDQKAIDGEVSPSRLLQSTMSESTECKRASSKLSRLMDAGTLGSFSSWL